MLFELFAWYSMALHTALLQEPSAEGFSPWGYWAFALAWERVWLVAARQLIHQTLL